MSAGQSDVGNLGCKEESNLTVENQVVTESFNTNSLDNLLLVF